MVMPLAGRVIAAVIGAVLVLGAGHSVTGTLIVSRPVSSRLTRLVDQIIDLAFQVAAGRATDYPRRDRLLAAQPAAILLTQLVAWLGVSFTGYALLLWPFARPWTRCPSCTACGSAGRPMWRRATPPTCRWSGSAPLTRCRPG